MELRASEFIPLVHEGGELLLLLSDVPAVLPIDSHQQALVRRLSVAYSHCHRND